MVAKIRTKKYIWSASLALTTLLPLLSLSLSSPITRATQTTTVSKISQNRRGGLGNRVFKGRWFPPLAYSDDRDPYLTRDDLNKIFARDPSAHQEFQIKGSLCSVNSKTVDIVSQCSQMHHIYESRQPDHKTTIYVKLWNLAEADDFQCISNGQNIKENVVINQNAWLSHFRDLDNQDPFCINALSYLYALLIKSIKTRQNFPSLTNALTTMRVSIPTPRCSDLMPGNLAKWITEASIPFFRGYRNMIVEEKRNVTLVAWHQAQRILAGLFRNAKTKNLTPNSITLTLPQRLIIALHQGFIPPDSAKSILDFALKVVSQPSKPLQGLQNLKDITYDEALEKLMGEIQFRDFQIYSQLHGRGPESDTAILVLWEKIILNLKHHVKCPDQGDPQSMLLQLMASIPYKLKKPCRVEQINESNIMGTYRWYLGFAILLNLWLAFLPPIKQLSQVDSFTFTNTTATTTNSFHVKSTDLSLPTSQGEDHNRVPPIADGNAQTMPNLGKATVYPIDYIRRLVARDSPVGEPFSFWRQERPCSILPRAQGRVEGTHLIGESQHVAFQMKAKRARRKNRLRQRGKNAN